MKKYILQLPQDLWNHIFHKLDKRDIEELSLASKKFLSVTNSYKTSLQITDDLLPSLPGILQRFQYLESITISVTSLNSPTKILRQISHSGSRHVGRSYLKKLNFGGHIHLENDDFMVIGDLFPWLEEINFLNLAHHQEHEFLNLQLKLTALKKVALGCTNNFPSNKSIISLTVNCPNLEEIDIEMCTGVRQETVGFIMRYCPKLTTLKIPFTLVSNANASLSVQNSIAYAKNLHSISFYGTIISKEVVCSFIEASLPLQKVQFDFIHVDNNVNIEKTNLLAFFQAYSSIKHLCLIGYTWLSDSSVETISQCLPTLTHIDLSYCFKLTMVTFYILTKKCPLLEKMNLAGTNINVDREVSSADLHEHKQLCHLNLGQNLFLNDTALGKVMLVCPNLQCIHISNCPRVTKIGVREILNTCVLLIELKIYGLVNVSSIFGKYFEAKKIGLKILEAGMTKMKNKDLSEIGKICNSLEFLGIRNCKRVTDIGVMEVVRNCKRLKQIDTRWCPNLSFDLTDEILRSRPSVKHIYSTD